MTRIAMVHLIDLNAFFHALTLCARSLQTLAPREVDERQFRHDLLPVSMPFTEEGLHAEAQNDKSESTLKRSTGFPGQAEKNRYLVQRDGEHGVRTT